jgi:addiction module HigA family antidote
MIVLEGRDVTQEQLAQSMGVSRYSVNQLVNHKRSITAEMALRIGRVTNTSPEFWLNLQRKVDLFVAREKLGSSLEEIDPLL